MSLTIHILLKSDATFGRGDGVAGLVDQEIEHDPATGLPFLHGRTLKGLLVEECANILYSMTDFPVHDQLVASASWLFGQAGSLLGDDANMRVGSARPPDPLCQAVIAEIATGQLDPATVLQTWSAIRRQTAIGADGVAEPGTLRAMRILLRHTVLVAPLFFSATPHWNDLALLDTCVRSLRRAGTGRNRGRGRIQCRLVDESEDERYQLIDKRTKRTVPYLVHFQDLLREGT